MLGLTRATDPAWIEAALARLDDVLVDHAHCEMKAAANAIALAARAAPWPRVVHELALLAEEELRHFRLVLAELARRGLVLGPPPVDPYAAELRRLAGERPSRLRPKAAGLVDRLLVAALIEARSCERFRLLSEGLGGVGQEELARFYRDLLAAEARHYRSFVDLALEVAGDEGEEARQRLFHLARAEGELSAALPGDPTVHG